MSEKGHILVNCESRGKCSCCSRKHHVSLREAPKQEVKTSMESEKKPRKAPDCSLNQEAKNLHVNTKASILLQSALAFVSDPRNPDKRLNWLKETWIYLSLQRITSFWHIWNYSKQIQILHSVDIFVQDARQGESNTSLRINALTVNLICSPSKVNS